MGLSRFLPPQGQAMIGLLAVVVLNAEPQTESSSSIGHSGVGSGSVGAAPCPRLISFYRVQPAIVEWCIRKPYEGM